MANAKTEKQTLEFIHFMKTSDPKYVMDTSILEKHPKLAIYGASGQINQPVKYNQIPSQCHQPEDPCQKKSLNWKTIWVYWHCNQ